MHIFELIIMLAACGGCAVAACFAVRRRPALRFPLIAAGFVLLTLNLLSHLMTERFYILFAESFTTEVLYAGSFVLVGVLSARYLNTSSRRVIFLVFTIVLSYFTLADHIFFAAAAGKVQSLDGKTTRGVTLQSTGYSCVAASLATVLRRWGIECTEGEIAYTARTSFRGTSVPRVPGAVRKLGAAKNLQAKVIKTTWDELRAFDVPCLLSTEYENISHCSALVGLDDKWVVTGEPLAGLIVQEREKYEKEWKWDGRAVVVAPDFLHSFSASDSSERCNRLFESLKSLGYDNRSEETVRDFQREHGLEPTGVLGWRTILVIDSLTATADRPRLSVFAGSVMGESGK